MTVRLYKGIELLDEREGDGPCATKGDVVEYCVRVFLRCGEEVTRDYALIREHGTRLETEKIEGVDLLIHKTQLGRRLAIAGIERSLYGMRRNGYREVMVAPHLAYGEIGVPGSIPGNALLRLRIWVRDLRQTV